MPRHEFYSVERAENSLHLRRIIAKYIDAELLLWRESQCRENPVFPCVRNLHLYDSMVLTKNLNRGTVH